MQLRDFYVAACIFDYFRPSSVRWGYLVSFGVPQFGWQRRFSVACINSAKGAEIEDTRWILTAIEAGKQARLLFLSGGGTHVRVRARVRERGESGGGVSASVVSTGSRFGDIISHRRLLINSRKEMI